MREPNERAELERRVDETERQGEADRETIRSLEDRGEADRETIRSLEHQGEADRETIRSLEHQAEVDHALIAQLEADGVIEREKIANLETALVAARRIGAAMGVLMANHKVTDAQAFDMLRRVSQNKHRKLRDIADDVMLTGILPT